MKEQLKAGILTHGVGQMHALARQLALELPPQACLALHGDLGAGKTSFVQGLGLAWGINNISSPTYTLYNLYEGTRQLCHLDAYRLKTPQAYEDLLVEELLCPPYCLAIEWPQRVASALPQDALYLYFNIVSPGVHRISSP